MALAVVSLVLTAGATAIARCMVTAARITRAFVLPHVLPAQLVRQAPSDSRSDSVKCPMLQARVTQQLPYLHHRPQQQILAWRLQLKAAGLHGPLTMLGLAVTGLPGPLTMLAVGSRHQKILLEHVREAVGAALAAATAMRCAPCLGIVVQILMTCVTQLRYRVLLQLVRAVARKMIVVVCLLLVHAGVIVSAPISTTAATSLTSLSSAQLRRERVMALAGVSLVLTAGATAIARCMVTAARITRAFVLPHVLPAQLVRQAPSDSRSDFVKCLMLQARVTQQLPYLHHHPQQQILAWRLQLKAAGLHGLLMMLAVGSRHQKILLEHV